MGMKSGLNVRKTENEHKGRKPYTAPGTTLVWLGKRTSKSGKVTVAAGRERTQDNPQILPWMTAGTVVPLAEK